MDPYFGAGRVNALAAVAQAPTPQPAPSPTPAPVPTDTVAPVITSISPTNGSIVSGGKATIRVTASDNVSVATIKLSVDGKLMTTVSGSSLSYSWNLRKVSSGVHTLTVTTQDGAGNSTSASVQVIK